jgi:hypothetical protein
MKRSRLATYAMGIAVAATMTGCGGGSDDGGDGGSGFADESASDIIKAASADMGDLKSVHLGADITSDGSTITMDLTLDTEGNCQGTVGIGTGSAEVLSADGSAWFKADEAFWREQAGDQADTVLSLVGDKWVVDTSSQFSSFCDLDGLLEDIGDPEDVEDAKTDGTEDVDGAEAVKIVGTEDSSETTVFVATDEPHYILKVEVTGDEEGEAAFSDFDEDVEVEAPAEADTVTLQ